MGNGTIRFICENCGKEVVKKSKQTTAARFCSRECYKEAMNKRSGENSRAYKKRIQHLEAKVQKMIDERTNLRDFVHILSDAVAKMPPIELIPGIKHVSKTEDLDPEDVIIHISDVHVGSWVKGTHMGDLSSYNYETFVERIQRFAKRVGSILRYHPNAIERAHIVFGGDIIDGGTIFRGQTGKIDIPVASQVAFAYERFAQFISAMASMFPEVVISGVPGNHGRIGMKGEMGPNDNLDWLLYYFLKERFKDVPNVRFNIPDTWWMVLEIRGWKFLVVHGEDIRSYLQIPFYGALRFKSKMLELFREMFVSNGIESPDFDAVIIAHHHNPANFNGILMNGSWVGGSEFSFKRLQAGNLPAQQMIGVHDRHVVSWRRLIYLEDKHERPVMPIYS